jgi:hypothetical protein
MDAATAKDVASCCDGYYTPELENFHHKRTIIEIASNKAFDLVNDRRWKVQIPQ